MARADLRGLLGNLDPTQTPDVVELQAEAVEPVHVDRLLARSVTGANPDRSETPSVPRFDDFERKETRLRADQLDALTALARALGRAKQAGAPRITDNTLIRVAVDLLLARASKLTGDTEADLRRSVGLRERGQE